MKISVNKTVRFINKYQGRCVIFLGHQDEPDRYAESLLDIARRRKETEIILVNLNLVNPKGIENAGVKVITPIDIFSGEDYASMDSGAYDLTRTWHKGLKDEESVTIYKNIKIAELAEAGVQQIFARAVRNAHVASWAINLFKPQSAVVIDELGDLAGAGRFMESEYHIPCSTITVRDFRFSVSAAARQIENKAALFASLILDNVLKRLLVSLGMPDKDGLIDKDLYSLFRDDWVKSRFIPFAIWSGFRMRMQLLFKDRRIYVPVIIRKSFKFLIKNSRFTDYWRRLRPFGEFQARLKYKGIKIWPLVENEIMETICYIFPQILGNIVFLERFYKKQNLKLIVLRDAVREPERSMISAAKILNIQTLVVQQGALSVENVYSRIYSDKIAVWGESAAKWYESFGNDTSRCIVTGSPKHDVFFEKAPLVNSSKVYSSLGLDPDKKTILHIMDFMRFYPMLSPSFLVDIERVVIADLLNAVKAIPDTQLILKFHPFEFPDAWERALRNYKNEKNIAIVKDFDFLELIKISSLVTTIFSTGGIEAQLFDKPLICFDYFKARMPIPYGESGVAVVVHRSDELIPAIRKIFEDASVRQGLDEKRPVFVRDYAYRFDGKSRERLLSVMRSMC